MNKVLTFIKTFRFRLTLWYAAFLLLMIFVLISGLGIVISEYKLALDPDVQNTTELEAWRQFVEREKGSFIHDLRNYSFIGVGIVIVIGAAGVYLFSGRMLKPITKVSSLAERSSYTNLKERLNYSGPNDEIKQLADTFDKMLGRLEGAVESQKQFIQDASHELRTPITTALTNIEVLEMNSETTIEDYQNLSKVLKNSLERMNNISNSLLLLSSDSDTGRKRSPVNLSEVVSDIVNESVTEARQQHIDISWNIPAIHPVINGDENRVKQAIFNLVDNAIKYNRPGGAVKITIHTKDQSAVVEIADTGIGIGPEDLPHIFDRFYRVDKSRSRLQGGSGLGLAIVKKIIEEHDGTISVTSTAGKGSTFFITLPLYLQ